MFSKPKVICHKEMDDGENGNDENYSNIFRKENIFWDILQCYLFSMSDCYFPRLTKKNSLNLSRFSKTRGNSS